MIWAITGDTHSNMDAYETVGADMAQYKPGRVIDLGDFVSYGGSPEEVMDFRNPNGVIGNHDYLVARELGAKIPLECPCDPHECAAWSIKNTAARLGEANRRVLTDFVESGAWRIDEGNLIFAHSTPKTPQRMEYIKGLADVEDYFPRREFEGKIAFVGHEHVPQIYQWEGDRVSGVRPRQLDYTEANGGFNYAVQLAPDTQPALIVVPSVGQPRDGWNFTGYALYNDVTRIVCIRRIPYDIKAAQAKLRAWGGDRPDFIKELCARLERGR